MEAIQEGFTWLIEFLKTVFDMLMSSFEMIGDMVNYVGVALNVLSNILYTIPPWIRVFGVISMSVALVYIIVGRETGKSGK